MLGLITESLTYMFPGGRALKLIKGGVNVTNSSNPLILAFCIKVSVNFFVSRIFPFLFKIEKVGSKINLLTL